MSIPAHAVDCLGTGLENRSVPSSIEGIHCAGQCDGFCGTFSFIGSNEAERENRRLRRSSFIPFFSLIFTLPFISHSYSPQLLHSCSLVVSFTSSCSSIKWRHRWRETVASYTRPSVCCSSSVTLFPMSSAMRYSDTYNRR